MHGRWYCSSSCFASAVEKELSALRTWGPDPANRVERMPLGLMLVSQGLLTSSEFQDVMGEQKESGGEIGELLVRRGSVSEKQVTAVRATQWGCPVFSAAQYQVQSKINIPSAFMRLYSMIPLHYVNATNLLLVGFVHNVEYGLLYAIEKMTGCKTEPCFVTPSDFRIQLQEIEQAKEENGESTARELEFESVHSSVEMARILCNYGAHLEADEAIIEKFKEHLWTRLKCGPKDVDLLFKVG
jgi:MSHA biogenesis protein MshE